MSAIKETESSTANQNSENPNKDKRRHFWKTTLKVGEQMMNVLTVLSLLFFLVRIYEKATTRENFSMKSPMRIHQKIRLVDDIEVPLTDQLMAFTGEQEEEEVIKDVAKRIEDARDEGIIAPEKETAPAVEKEHPNVVWWKDLPSDWKRVFARALKKRKALKISDLKDIMALTDIDLSSTKGRKSRITDLTPLKMLKNLRHLDCSNSPIRDLSALSEMQSLEILDCRGTYVRDLSALKNLRGLKYFDCSSTKVSDLSPLANSTKMEGLSFAETPVTDISFASEMKNLKVLDCSDSKLTSLASVENHPDLNTVWSSHNEVTDISPLMTLPALKQVSLYGLKIEKSEVEDLKKAKPSCKVKY